MRSITWLLAMSPDREAAIGNAGCSLPLLHSAECWPWTRPCGYGVTEREGEDMDLREYPVGDGIEARYASVEELRDAADKSEEPDLKNRLLVTAALRDLLEARDRNIVDELIGRFDAGFLDDVTIVLEMTTQQAVEEELRTGDLSLSGDA